MILKFIKHDLSKAGMDIFPAWFEETKKLMAQSEGFVTAHYVLGAGNNQPTYLMLYFEDEAALSRWATSSIHHGVLGKLKPYWQSEWVAKTIEL